MRGDRCSCVCHTYGKRCSGFGAGDNNCCSQPHVMWDEWKTRIESEKKNAIMALARKDSSLVNSENEINNWVKKMEIPEHIKGSLLKSFWFEGLHCANFDDICDFDVQGNKKLVFDVLQKFL